MKKKKQREVKTEKTKPQEPIGIAVKLNFKHTHKSVTRVRCFGTIAAMMILVSNPC